jgi:hypothetical protein
MGYVDDNWRGADEDQPITVFIMTIRHQVARARNDALRTRHARRSRRPAAVFRGVYGAGAENLTEIRFEATSGKFLVARMVEDGRIEIELDSETSEELFGEEGVEIRVCARAFW